ncbi:hypothetical protein [Pseudomonas syringae]|uniref:hypothetical protein n=1 Tax=Pseudomonas syringae TaxID=317 RepID=UPI0012AEDF3B|nr:hypothetical protein [Pseudomonas syringae]
MSNKSDKSYSPNQVFTNEQIDSLAMDGQTFVGGTIANEINLEGVEPFSREVRNQIFSAELINKVNNEREWTGGIIVPETDFSEDDDFDGHDDRNVVFRV